MHYAFTFLTHTHTETLLYINQWEFFYCGAEIAAIFVLNKVFTHCVETENLAFTHKYQKILVWVGVCKLKVTNCVASKWRYQILWHWYLLINCAIIAIPEANQIVNTACD